jgi:cobalamin synthase
MMLVDYTIVLDRLSV